MRIHSEPVGYRASTLLGYEVVNYVNKGALSLIDHGTVLLEYVLFVGLVACQEQHNTVVRHENESGAHLGCVKGD